MPETEHDQDYTYTGSMQLRDGPIHLIVDTSLQKYYGSYHAQTGTVIYGTEITLTDQTTLAIGERNIELDTLDRAEMISLICEQSDAWLTIRTNDEIHEMLSGLSATPKFLNPDMVFPPLHVPRTVAAAARDDVVRTAPEVRPQGSIFSFTDPPPASPAQTAAGPSPFGRAGQQTVPPTVIPQAAAPAMPPLQSSVPQAVTPPIGRGGIPRTPPVDVSLGRFELPETLVTQADLDNTASSLPTSLPEQKEILSWDQPDSAPAFPGAPGSPASDTKRRMMPAEAARAAQLLKQQMQQAQPRAEVPRITAPESSEAPRSEGLFAQIRRRFTGR